MPTPAITSMASKAGISVVEAEKKWEKAKIEASKSYSQEDDKYWGTVMKIFKAKLGLSESVASQIINRLAK